MESSVLVGMNNKLVRHPDPGRPPPTDRRSCLHPRLDFLPLLLVYSTCNCRVWAGSLHAVWATRRLCRVDSVGSESHPSCFRAEGQMAV